MGKKIIHKHFLSFIFPQEQMNFTHRKRASAQCKTSNSQWIKFHRPQIIKHRWRYPGPSELADTEGWRTILSLRSLSSRGLLSPQRSWNHSPTERWLHINFEGKTKFRSWAHVMLQRPTDDTRTGLNPQIHPFCSYPMGQSQSQSVFYHQELQRLHGTKGFSVGSDGKESASNVGSFSWKIVVLSLTWVTASASLTVLFHWVVIPFDQINFAVFYSQALVGCSSKPPVFPVLKHSLSQLLLKQEGREQGTILKGWHSLRIQ